MSRRSQRLLPAPPVDASSPVPVGGSPRFQFRRFTLRRRLLTAVTRNGGSGASSAYGYDAFARLTSLAHDASGTGNDLTLGYGYNPAGQIVGRTVSDDDYVWTPTTGGTASTLNGLNQTTAVGGVSVTFDANQNATGITGHTYSYDAANRLTSATPSGGAAASFVFDPLDRLASSTVSSTTTRYQYAEEQLVTEYDASGAVTRRYVPGLGLDGVVTAYTGSGVGTRDWLLADERGSVVALTGSTGAVSTINRYDEYGVPHTGNAGRFGYTGQAWMAEAGAWNYRARAYLPGVGRFLQTDPIGYAAGANLYGYVGADPVNFSDPLGLDPGGYQDCWWPGDDKSKMKCRPFVPNIPYNIGIVQFGDFDPTSVSFQYPSSEGGTAQAYAEAECINFRNARIGLQKHLPSYWMMDHYWNNEGHMRFFAGSAAFGAGFWEWMADTYSDPFSLLLNARDVHNDLTRRQRFGARTPGSATGTVVVTVVLPNLFRAIAAPTNARARAAGARANEIRACTAAGMDY